MCNSSLYKYFLTLAIISTFCCACKKDLYIRDTIEQVESHTTYRLNQILFTDPTHGYIVGGDRFYDGIILKTGDGGKTWYKDSTISVEKALYGITYTPQNNIWTVGFDGKILKSANRESWQFYQGLYLPYKSVAALKNNRILLTGGISFYFGFISIIDTNGNMLSHQEFDFELNGTLMLNEDTGFICGMGVVLKTYNGGKDWVQLPIINDNFTSLYFFNAQHGFVCGYNGSIYETTDGGNSWICHRNGNNILLARYKLLDIHFVSPNTGYAVGENGLIICTNNGGKDWVQLPKVTSSALRHIYASSATLFIVGDAGAIYKISL